MRKISMATRDDLIASTRERYRSDDRTVRGRILDAFTAVTGLHRKHAARLLRGARRSDRSKPRPERRVYNDAMDNALVVLWEASDRICSKRLRVMLPVLVEAMERHGHVSWEPKIRLGVLAMSAATIDRRLEPFREGVKRRRRAPPSAAVKATVPIRTFAQVGRPGTGLFRGRSRRAFRSVGARPLHSDAHAHRYCHWLDRDRTASFPRAGSADAGVERHATLIANAPAWSGYG